jgi:PAS domain S-box-containing protein
MASAPLSIDRAILDLIPVAIAVAYDSTGDRIMVNRYFAELLGISTDSEASLTAPPPERPNHYAILRGSQAISPDELPLQIAARTNIAVKGWEADIVRDDGARITIRGNAVPVRDAHGRSTGAIGVFLDVSDRHRAERLVRSVLDGMSDAFHAADRNWRVQYVNDRFVQLAGVRREDVIGQVVWDVFPEAMRTRVYEEAQRAMAEQRTAVIEEYYSSLNRWFETRLYPTDDGLASFITDVSERKRVEQQREAFLVREHAARVAPETAHRSTSELLASAQRLAAIVESSEDAIIGKTLDGIISSWNPAAERMFGYSAAEVVGRSIKVIIPADRLAEEDDHLARVRAGQRVQHQESTRIAKDGRTIDVSLTISPIRGTDDAIIGASTIIRDVTEQRRMAVAAERDHYRAAFLAELGVSMSQTSDIGEMIDIVANRAVPALADWAVIDVVDEHGSVERRAIAHVNPDKVASERFIRQLYDHAVSPFDVPAVIRTCHPVLVPSVSDSMIGEAAAGDEERVAAARDLAIRSFACVPLAVHGRCLGALTVATSASGRVYDHDDLQFFLDLAARTALAIENARAYEEANNANRLKDEFLATLSHELRTPLNAILGYARMLRSGIVPPDKSIQAIDVLERNASSLTRIVSDVLDVSRIVSGKLRLDVQRVDLPLLVTEAVATVLPAANAKGVRIETAVDPAAPPVSGDPDRLRQVVWNLLSNAVKFTPPGGRVHVRVEPAPAGAAVVVRDTGVGIAREFLPFIFEPFRQLDSTSTRVHGGLGLGLTIARHIVDMHGGTIEAASDGTGTGATFTVRVPMVQRPSVQQSAERRARGRDRDSSPALPSLDGVSVLVVDDDEDTLRLVREILRFAGGDVVTANSAERALQEVQRRVPHVLLTDLAMPLQDGFELLDRVRHLPDGRGANVPAAALTAYARSEDRAKALASGFQIHLTKPVDPEELLAAVALLAGRMAGTRERPTG